MPTLQDELDDLKDDLEDSKDLTGEEEGPLDPPTRSAVKQKLERAETRIDLIFDPNEEPSLDPTGAGSIDSSVNPTTLPEHAQTTHSLAVDGHTESTGSSPDHEVIGTKLKTIKHLLPDYRRLAGIS